ncbi:unnamed protein product [Psylliodes chrysocephalus]|uniref:Uncharacterized protein n=1 Tax=Psylliodes chrysocephalus TaxID=3402493 RepID=A0A9P0D5D3_9CUCU|nr:unnamed protein product [Psylliodes chrysocephala]
MNRGKLMVELCNRIKTIDKHSSNSFSKERTVVDFPLRIDQPNEIENIHEFIEETEEVFKEKTVTHTTERPNENYIVIAVNDLETVAQEDCVDHEQHEEIIIDNGSNLFALKEDNINIIIYNVQDSTEINNEKSFETNDEERRDSTYILQNNDTDSTSSDQEPQSFAAKRKRSRFANPSTWERNIRKQKRLAGESYIDRKGREISEKVVNLVDCQCRFKCRDAITVAQQKSLFQEYWSFGSTVRQKDFLCSLIEETAIARKRKRSEDSGIDKTVSRSYKLSNGNSETIRVCQKFFCTFAISKRIPTDALLHKSINGTYRGQDKRKGRPATNVTPHKKVREIQAILAAFPKVPSHYCRQRSSRLYLSPDLLIEKLYTLYKDKCGPEAVNLNVFRRLFKEHDPPLAIFKPKKDQCSICNEAERLNSKGTDIKYQEYVRQEDAIKAMKENDKKASKNDSKISYGTFDLQAVLTLPYAGDCQIYYKRKLSLFNFTVFDFREDGHCFLWDETNGKKGKKFKFFEVNPSEINSENIILESKYKNHHEISTAKKRDLISLLKQGVIPQEYAAFYNNLPSSRGIRDVAVWSHDQEIENDVDEIDI